MIYDIYLRFVNKPYFRNKEVYVYFSALTTQVTKRRSFTVSLNKKKDSDR